MISSPGFIFMIGLNGFTVYGYPAVFDRLLYFVTRRIFDAGYQEFVEPHGFLAFVHHQTESLI